MESHRERRYAAAASRLATVVALARAEIDVVFGRSSGASARSRSTARRRASAIA
jgi:hypothetical protein